MVRDAPGSPTDYFSSLGAPFTCAFAGSDVISYCSNTTFNLTSIDTYDPSCIVGVDGCRNVSCEYGSLSRSDYQSICADNDCQYGLVNYFQVFFLFVNVL